MYKAIACLSVLFLIPAYVLADHFQAPSSPDQAWEAGTSAAAAGPDFTPLKAGPASAPAFVVATSSETKDSAQAKFDPDYDPPTPEPCSLVLLSLVGLGGAVWRRRGRMGSAR